LPLLGRERHTRTEEITLGMPEHLLHARGALEIGKRIR
jgi:hypothetical protein